jgi:hypothetical protein
LSVFVARLIPLCTASSKLFEEVLVISAIFATVMMSPSVCRCRETGQKCSRPASGFAGHAHDVVQWIAAITSREKTARIVGGW